MPSKVKLDYRWNPTAAESAFVSKFVDEYETKRAKDLAANSAPEVAEVKTKKEKHDLDYTHFEEVSKQQDREEERRIYEEKQREAAQWCTIDHEHGPNCPRPAIPGCSHDHSAERAIYEKTNPEKLEMADSHKKTGNERFKEGNVAEAAVWYRKALLVYDYTFPEGDEEKAHVAATQLACHLNLAACKLKMASVEPTAIDDVLIQTRLALKIDPKSAKAHYRRGLGFMHKLAFADARKSLEEARALAPRDAGILAAVRELNSKVDAYDKKRRKVAAAMVQGDRKDGAGATDPVTDAAAKPKTSDSEPLLPEAALPGEPKITEITSPSTQSAQQPAQGEPRKKRIPRLEDNDSDSDSGAVFDPEKEARERELRRPPTPTLEPTTVPWDEMPPPEDENARLVSDFLPKKRSPAHTCDPAAVKTGVEDAGRDRLWRLLLNCATVTVALAAIVYATGI